MIARYRFILFYLLIGGAWLFLTLRTSQAVPVARPFDEFPIAFQQWQMVSQERFDPDVMNVLKPTDYLSRRYEGANGKRVSLYIGYHDGGTQSGEIHSPRHCLPGAGWQKLSTVRTELVQPEGSINLARAVYQKGQNKELFIYWFQVRGESIADEYRLKLAGITGSLAHGRKDASFIRVSVPFEVDEQEAAVTGTNFIADLYPLLREFIPL